MGGIRRRCTSRVLAIAAAIASAAITFACGDVRPIDFGGPTAGWPEYGGDKGGMRHSPLTQIDASNVGDLEVAWTHHSGDVSDGSTGLAPSSYQNTPILRGDTLYLCTPFNKVIALDAATGAERWRFDPQVDVSQIYVQACRGVAYWVDPSPAPNSSCVERVITGTLDARLIALDARTGRPCAGFGRDGVVDLAEGIGDRAPGEYGVTSPPALVNGVIVTGAMVLDNRRVDAPGGVVRGYDARSGALRWSWDPVPPGRAARTSGDVRYQRGTTNSWSIPSADPQLGLVYVPTGNTSPDYYGGYRDGLDYYSSSVVALDAQTGEVRWHFQTVKHDIWDYDVPSQPVLFDYPSKDGPIPALVQATKLGHLFVLDRRSGEPIFGVQEKPVPQGAVAEDFVEATQPFPTKPDPIHPGAPLDADDAFGFTFWDRGKCRDMIASARSEGIFTPPSTQGSIHFPGMMGGSNWGSVAIDPERGVLVANVSRVATYVRLVPRDEETPEQRGAKYGYEPADGTPYGVVRMPLLSPLGAPCNPPPWGTLVGIDLESGEQLYEVTLGTTRDMAPWPIWLDTGTPNQGGAIVTGSGLTFIGAASDSYLRAFDTMTGEELWRGRLPGGGQATPMTYRVGEADRQFVVIAAGGHGILGTPIGDSLVAFALPLP